MKECIEEGILQSYYDGELPRVKAERVASHLASCNTCAEAARELESESLLVSRALHGEIDASVPSKRLRHRVDAAIAGLDIVKPARSAAPVRRWLRSFADLFALSPQRGFSYAGLALIIIVAATLGLIYFKRGPDSSGVEIANEGGAAQSAAASPLRSPELATTVNPTSPGEERSVIDRASSMRVSKPPSKLLPGERKYVRAIAALDAKIKSDSSSSMRPGLQVEYRRNLALLDHAIAATRDVVKKNPGDPDAAQFMFAAYQSKVDLLSQVAEARLFNKER